MRLLRMNEVTNKVGLKKAAIYGMIQEGLFPPQIKIGKASLWLEEEIDVIISLWVAQASKEEIKKTVQELVRKRKEQKVAV
ncbi:helix-turn-helix transcriptional regulator [Thermodesulfovibrio hydrogeniphilus]